MLYMKPILTFLFLLNITSITKGQPSQLDILLQKAILKGDPKAVNDLIEKGANVQESYIPISPSTFISPLKFALRLYNRPEQGLISNMPDRYNIIDILIRHGGAHLNGQPWTILHQLASENNVQDMNTLQYRGANINAEDVSGNTPLHKAVEFLKLPLKDSRNHYFTDARVTVEFLIKNDANIDAKNNDGDTPLHLAIKNTVFLDQKPPFFYRTLTRHFSKAQRSRSSNRDIPSTLLPISIPILDLLDGSFVSSYYKYYIKFIRTLIENGADTYIENNDGLTPLDLMAQKEYAQYYTAVTHALKSNIVNSDSIANGESADKNCKDNLL